ncbi:unnamed protein product [Staurois parvus]|uniref:Uncharacterized protein n=1 Tax=Staurois parvus TaxID=386267 RepID=A0ABN9AUV4_9NEOB|nr:unnamed protein product [Staurois parvus]
METTTNIAVSMFYGHGRRGLFANMYFGQGRTDHLETRALPEGPGSVGGPMRCPWYLFS